MKRSLFRWLSNILLSLTSIVLLFVAGEMVLAMYLPKPIIWIHPQESYIYHPKLLHQLRPNQNSFTHSFTVITNSYGLRNDEFSLKPKPQTFRILCLGDSLTFGNGVKVQDTYPQRLQLMLNSHPGGKSFEVINAGVPAYDTWQEAVYLREYGVNFSPQLVIIGFYANDIVPRPKTIRQTLDESGFRSRDGVKRIISSETVHVLKRSRVLLFVKDLYEKVINRLNPSSEYRHKLSLLEGTNEPFIENGWKEVETSIGEMRSLGEKHGFQLLVVLFPMADEVIGGYPNATYRARLREMAERYEIHFVDLLGPFKTSSDDFGPLFIEWDGHPNARGYEIAAREIGKFLLSNGVVLPARQRTQGITNGKES